MEIVRWIILLFWRTHVFAYRRRNIALLKDTMQSTTHYRWNNDHLYSKYANDGKLNQSSNYYPYYCTHTLLYQPEHWWAVDLGGIYDIDSLTIYNRKDCCGHRLFDYKILLFQPYVPSWGTFNTKPGTLCHFHSGRSPDILNLSCDKKTSGRYLQVYKRNRNIYGGDALALCEVQVFIANQGQVTQFCKEMRKIPLLYLSSQFNLTNVQCSCLCKLLDNCLGFQSGKNNTCDLYQTSETVDIEDNGSYYYEKC